MTSSLRVEVEKLRRRCRPEELDFCLTSADVPPLADFIGQERAVRAMEFGLTMKAPGYNIYVAGPPGTGKSTYTQAVVSQYAAREKPPQDWCYLYNFADPDRPLAVALPAGAGQLLQKDMEELVADLRTAIPKAFEEGQYERDKAAIVQEFQRQM
ncbi:MAG: Lon-like protease helical domain-containing protein, partial [Desulfotomaculales bacterium]